MRRSSTSDAIKRAKDRLVDARACGLLRVSGPSKGLRDHRKRARKTFDGFQIDRLGPSILRVVKEVVASDDRHITPTTSMHVRRLAPGHRPAWNPPVDPQAQVGHD